ncbi:MAG: N-acetylmuramoyl-L-alanine amidase [Candidatus Riflebacteria bacterium]|nr:N-acetylmuramoyl-L-alanine amidase [Candidatus Riflebacteria bacterium]
MKQTENHGKVSYVLVIGFFFLALLAHGNLLAEELPGQSDSSYQMEKTGQNQIVIAIDPGHPSETSGGCAHHGVTELQICWEVALRLEKMIDEEPSLRSIKTKPAVDTMVTNRQRAECANEAKAAIMVRLHCDSANGAGCTVYYPDKQGTTQGVTGPSEEVISQSSLAAQCMQIGLAKVIGPYLKLNPVKTDSMTYVGSKQGALTGSIFSKVPAIVVEMVYLNNASEAAFIQSFEGQDLLARGMLAGIKEFLVSDQKTDF